MSREKAYNAKERAEQAARKAGADTAGYDRAKAHVLATRDTSVAALQVACKLSYNGAVEYLARMEAEGIISAPNEGTGTRVVQA